jgi:NAD+ synthase
MRDFNLEVRKRTLFIRNVLESAGAAGIVFGNSGGKDCALAGILCKMACENTLGLIMPCGSKQNYGSDLDDAKALAKQFGITSRTIDLTETKIALMKALAEGNGPTLSAGEMRQGSVSDSAVANIAPRIRMAALYSIALDENRLVAGTGNRSEIHMGYFTKWGDGAYDFNPIGDLTATEVYKFLHFLKAPVSIIDKAPSAGLFDGQTDEGEMGVTYKSIDEYLQTGIVNERDQKIIDRFHNRSGHKRKLPVVYKET